MKLTVLSGTNRPGSQTRKVAGYVAARLQEILNETEKTGGRVELVDLQELPASIFSPGSYATKPSEFEKFKTPMIQTDGILTVMPEYNGGFPGVLKYFIDMLPFPESLQKKPAAFIGVAAGRFGALRPVEQMQMIWAYRNAYLFPERVFISQVHEALEESGRPKDPFVQKLLESQLKNFVSFAKTFT